jgi:hypothetical protein
MKRGEQQAGDLGLLVVVLALITFLGVAVKVIGVVQ